MFNQKMYVILLINDVQTLATGLGRVVSSRFERAEGGLDAFYVLDICSLLFVTEAASRRACHWSFRKLSAFQTIAQQVEALVGSSPGSCPSGLMKLAGKMKAPSPSLL